MMKRSAFTLIELLVVVAIVTVLAVVVILTLNPAELLRQSRDTARLSDMANLNQAIALYQTDQPGGSLGTASTTYLSLIDPAATTTAGTDCAGIVGLPQLPAIYSYHCAASSTLRLTNGTNGWLPVNLSSISSGSPFGLLPLDPTNTSSSRLYYAYSPSGTQFELTTPMEAAKDKLGGSADKVSGDGGTKATVYETGTNLAVEPLDYGDQNLVGYWTFDEGTGTVAYDYSGNNASGSWSGSAPFYTAARIGSYAGNFNGSNLVSVPAATAPNLTTHATISFWMLPSSSGYCVNPISKWSSTSDADYVFYFGGPVCNGWASPSIDVTANAGGTWQVVSPVANASTGIWMNVVWTYTSSGNSVMYINGVLAGTGSGVGALHSNSDPLGMGNPSFSNLLDDVRIYNRALSAAEIQALYNSQK